MEHNKHFSLEEARTLLPVIIQKLERVMDLNQALEERGYDIHRHQYFGGIGPNGTGKFPADMDELVEIVREITSDGVIIKSVDDGLIDFPHIRPGGEEVYLCYKLGEDGIEFWHGIYDGFAGRRSIDEL